MGYQNGNRPDGIDQLIEDAMTDLSDLYNDVLNGKQGPNAIAASITFISETVAAVAAAHKELADTRETAAEHSIAKEVKDYSRFMPLLAWRERSTDHWGEDLISTLCATTGYTHSYRQPPAELIQVRDEFVKMDYAERRAIVEALYPSDVGRGFGYED